MIIFQTESYTDYVSLYNCVEDKCNYQWPFVSNAGLPSTPFAQYSSGPMLRVEFQTDWHISFSGFYAGMVTIKSLIELPTFNE